MNKIFEIAGNASTIIVGLAILWKIGQWFLGIRPVMLRLGKGLWGRKIAIFAKNDNFSELKNLLTGANLFREKNIIRVSQISDLESSEPASLFLLKWADWKEHIDEVLKKKNNNIALIIYTDPNEIDGEMMNKLQGYKHTNVVNFRNRLLGDIIMSIITMDYDK